MTTIAFDIDGVIADFVSEFRKVVLEEYGARLTETDIRGHSLHLALGVPKEEARELVGRTLQRDLDLYPGAAEGLAALVRAGAEIHIITARAPVSDGNGETQGWLAGRGLVRGEHFHRLVTPRRGPSTRWTRGWTLSLMMTPTS